MDNELKKYQKYLKSLDLAPSTAKIYIWHLNKFLKWLDNRRLTDKLLQEYFNYILRHYKRVATINLNLIIVNKYLEFIGRRTRFDLISHKKSTLKILNPQELQNFLDQPLKNKTIVGYRDKALVEMLYSTGLKVGQINQLKINQIDFIKKELFVNKKNKIILSPLSWFYLYKYLQKISDHQPDNIKNNNYLFTNFDRAKKGLNQPLSIRSIERIIDKYGRQMPVPLSINPQILRNTLAYSLKSEGAKGQDIALALHFKTKLAAQEYWQRI